MLWSIGSWVGHKTAKIFCHWSLSFATAWTRYHARSIIFSSASTVLCHVAFTRDLHLYCLTVGVHLKTICLGIFFCSGIHSVCPSQWNSHAFISLGTVQVLVGDHVRPVDILIGESAWSGVMKCINLVLLQHSEPNSKETSSFSCKAWPLSWGCRP